MSWGVGLLTADTQIFWTFLLRISKIVSVIIRSTRPLITMLSEFPLSHILGRSENWVESESPL